MSVIRVAFTKAKSSLIMLALSVAAAAALVTGVNDSSPVFVAAAFGIGFLAVQWGVRAHVRFTDTNDDIERRVQKLEELIDQAHSDIVIVSGALFHQVYDHPMTYEAFRRAGLRKVTITIYYTAPRLDEKTVRFRALAEGNRWPIAPLVTTVPHVVIVDRRHVREELDSGPDSATNKLALIRYDVPKIAREFYRRVAQDAAKAMAA
ncbi:MAG TPA: hypothetical protein VGO52_06995 [Hyphomonadaceae bacterium]|nr:hypothetical protein [Hyphomonadaceae bacterium]